MAETTNTGLNPVGGSSVYNLDKIFQDTINYEPAEDDIAGKEAKKTFQYNATQSIIDQAHAKEMADYNAGISKELMMDAAGLELANFAG